MAGSEDRTKWTARAKRWAALHAEARQIEADTLSHTITEAAALRQWEAWRAKCQALHAEQEFGQALLS